MGSTSLLNVTCARPSCAVTRVDVADPATATTRPARTRILLCMRRSFSALPTTKVTKGLRVLRAVGRLYQSLGPIRPPALGVFTELFGRNLMRKQLRNTAIPRHRAREAR